MGDLKTKNRIFTDNEVFTAAEFKNFPAAIRKYIENNGYIGKPKMNLVKMEYHDGDFVYFDGVISSIVYE